MALRILAEDIVRFRDEAGEDVATLFWGDRIEQVGDGNEFDLVTTVWDDERRDYRLETKRVRAAKKPKFRDEGVFKARFIDVGQGDGAIFETPDDRMTVIDGGFGPWFRRYVHRAFAHRLANGPIELDAIVVTHGDADHYEGLVELLNHQAGGRPLVTTRRIFHNGLAKKSTERNTDTTAFGATAEDEDGRPWVTDLVDDITEVDDARLNRPFKAWKKAVAALREREPELEIRRVQLGDDDAFGFLGGALTNVLGPIAEEIDGTPALPFLKDTKNRYSVSHTINGHSIVLKLQIGNVRILFGADLNIDSEERLLEHARAHGVSLEAEVLKVPHHGSHEFVPALLKEIAPVVSVVSSGDQAIIAGSDHIHPRAGLVGALGKYSRESVERPLVYVTEMVAYFRPAGRAVETRRDGTSVPLRNAHEKKTFGIVHVRTDGERVLVATHSGESTKKESYVFRVAGDGTITFEEPRIN